MIVLRRLGGQLIALNPDLIERVEITPDTVVTLVDEKKFLIDESLEDVLQLIADYRAYVLARSRDISITEKGANGRPALHVVPTELVSNLEQEADPAVVAMVESLEAKKSADPSPLAEAFQAHFVDDDTVDGRPDPGRAGRGQGRAPGRSKHPSNFLNREGNTDTDLGGRKR